jgi:hypothetical protein
MVDGVSYAINMDGSANWYATVKGKEVGPVQNKPELAAEIRAARDMPPVRPPRALWKNLSIIAVVILVMAWLIPNPVEFVFNLLSDVLNNASRYRN